MHICILETDTPTKDESEHDSYGKIFEELFEFAAKELQPPIDMQVSSAYVVEGKYPQNLDKIDGIVITGSKFDAHDEETKWILDLVSWLDRTWKENKNVKMSGVCFGHQILARMLGGELEAGKDWELSLTELNLTDDGKKIFGTKESTISLHQMHSDCVTKAPEGCKVWASSEHTEIQGLYIPNRLFTTQGHLGFDEQMVNANLDARVEKDLMEKEEAEEAKETSHHEHDGLTVAKAILRFIKED
ncbi:putative Class I glutamine amidotransferase [Taphrina deformans PYCC 5710]|uniref:Class I glutamine amidotransferase n=1 Tax=Taphrina deformans (strain PYCC 5710 / ATCC 11124 / CBS 356.35 / IMI 108563 / JCM 9778 / NBRC 8474) TaxID=1097556 RepID=R4XDI8_TAPDE|nr:putative Class I glutamine amidotransferase [Taphrina deformans PYCC 5710]|eukprot:CCG83656.1 putative Class I glutamine amidotransferase [Taphrina deformans PYCC 5710]